MGPGANTHTDGAGDAMQVVGSPQTPMSESVNESHHSHAQPHFRVEGKACSQSKGIPCQPRQ